METFEGDLSYSSDEVHLFDFDFGVEEEYFKWLGTFEEDLSHSTDEIYSFDFNFWVEEEFFETFEDIFSQLTDNIHSWVVIG